MTGAALNPIEASGDAPRPPAAARPELLAPAGDWECVRAAVENGADAVYFGLDRFNARMRARNFTASDLPGLMEFLHRRGVQGYVTFNTLVFADEMAEAEEFLRALIAAGVDAAIIQDVGICRLIRRLSPDFPMHASTQMTITSAAGVEFARELGCSLVVLARECSLKEIESLQAGRAAGAGDGPSAKQLPLEVFVHGALCVAYSGQCLTSEALGGRSANRGECAQACRLPYELICDGKSVPLGDRRYLLSPQDLAGLDLLPELVRAGVASLKIEGRLKTPEYVANITRIYCQALDALIPRAAVPAAPAGDEGRGESAPPQSATLEFEKLREVSRYDLEMAFSRGLHTGWFRGNNHQQLVHARFGKKRGVYLGEVRRVHHDGVALELAGPLKPGDGVVFDAGHPEHDEEGGRVYALETRGRETVLGFGRGDVDFTRIHPGDKLWKTSDPELDRRLRRSFAGEGARFQRPVNLEVHGRVGQSLTLLARDEIGHVAQVESAMPLAVAGKQPLTTEKLRAQLGRLGGTPFVLQELQSFLVGPVMLPVSELNRLRREMVARLEALRAQPKRWTLNPDAANRRPEASPSQSTGNGPAQLIALVRDLEQLEAALAGGAATVYCEFEDPKKYRDAVTRFRSAASHPPGFAIFAAPPRIFKMGEEWTLQQVRSCDADGYLVRNYDHLRFFAGHRCVGDYTLNIANGLAADYFRNGFALERVTASYDLNFGQLEALLRSAPPEWFEITIHQHMPMFHMEHCVFCAFLSSGTDYRNCGRPCDKHQVQLRDRAGAAHPLKADVGCRNTVFNARAQTGAEYVSRMLGLGARHFRIEFLNETPAQVGQILGKYQRLLRGEIDGGALWRDLKVLNQLGVTRGQLAG